ncbi:ABC transporter ATP-binding protein [Paenibacillus abyssi]|uniref:Multidrug resistance ABC transporter ATP-binding/permease protein YheH n=1 Tax=Paenibacillus abyssi TaxID=1340531 RepID=A0A917FMB3_9BACL|nr:ABC transporter ATP-binding protein [Paenibacillus abyssi]GGF91201.1 putative multidrug resistance ABC transporter ATP-binding/permease protein YheH [Paenibacillus abyssi]
MSKPHTKSVAKRLFSYMLLFKRRITVAILILIAAMLFQLAGPMIAKVIIDDHILAIEKDWYELAPRDVPDDMNAVPFQDKAFVRSDWAREGELGQAAAVANIRQEGASFVLQSDSIGTFTLTPAEVWDFYQYDVQPVMQLVGLIVLLAICASGLNFVQSFMLQSSAQRIVQRIRMDVFRNMHRIDIRYYDNTPIGQVVSRVANDTENVKDLYMSFMATFVVSGLNILGVFGALLFLDWRMALICFILLPIYTGIIVLHLKYSRKYVAAIRARLAEMNAMLNETIQIMPILQAFRREQSVRSEFEALNDDRYRNQIMQFRIFAFSGRNAVYFVGRIFTAMIIWYFGSGSLESAISFGVFYAFIDYLGRIFEPIIGIFDQMMNAQRAVVSAERVFELMDKEGEDIDAKQEAARPQGHVTFSGVTFGYKREEPVLRDISFEAGRGETIALVGHTGSGKSSIMNLLLGFYEPDEGTIRIDGEDITQMSKQALRKHMGIVLQDPFLFTGDIRFNVRLHNQEISDEQVRQALREVGAEPFVRQLSKGIEEPVVERGSTLSAGQRQLVSFARALSFDPAILILDEATSSIDSETEALIQKALDVLRHGRTTFIIAHRLSTIKEADTILVLHRGEIVERGTHEQLMALEGRYYRMYQLQSNETAGSIR